MGFTERLRIGSSTTFGTGATRDERTYPAQLELLLNAAAQAGAAPAGRTYQVLNAGVSGWNSADCLINLELRLLELQPDALLIYEAANDGRVIQAQGFLPDYSHLRRPPAIVRLSRFERFLLGNVRTYAHLAHGTDPDRKPGALADLLFVEGYTDLAVPSTEQLNEAGIATFARNLESMVAVARARGIETVFSTFAVRDSGTEGFEGLGPYMRAANRAVIALAERLHVPVVPAAERLDDRAELFDDWIHFNDAGERRHAEVVADFLREQGLFGLTPTR